MSAKEKAEARKRARESAQVDQPETKADQPPMASTATTTASPIHEALSHGAEEPRTQKMTLALSPSEEMRLITLGIGTGQRKWKKAPIIRAVINALTDDEINAILKRSEP